MLRRLTRRLFNALGFDVVRRLQANQFAALAPDISNIDLAILRKISPFTMTSIERQIAVIQSVRHLALNSIDGCFVECGVWRGGSAMAMALTLLEEHDTQRKIYLYDTFEGMTAPTDLDRTADGTLASTQLEHDPTKSQWTWAVAGLDEVRLNMASTGYPENLIKYIKGPVEQTIPAQSPSEPICLLRLDTDWYESTRHELGCLFPLLRKGGIMIVDDYGHWGGARKAVDEYLASLDETYYLHRIDYTGRLLVKA